MAEELASLLDHPPVNGQSDGQFDGQSTGFIPSIQRGSSIYEWMKTTETLPTAVLFFSVSRVGVENVIGSCQLIPVKDPLYHVKL